MINQMKGAILRCWGNDWKLYNSFGWFV